MLVPSRDFKCFRGATLDAKTQSSFGFSFQNNLNRGRRTKRMKMLKKGRCTLCWWWSVCSFFFVYIFHVFVAVICCFIFEKQPHPSAALLRTPKHLGPLLCTGPPLLLLYSFSADAYIIYTVYSICKPGQNCIKNQLNVTTAAVIFCSRCTSITWSYFYFFCFIMFQMFDQSFPLSLVRVRRIP